MVADEDEELEVEVYVWVVDAEVEVEVEEEEDLAWADELVWRGVEEDWREGVGVLELRLGAMIEGVFRLCIGFLVLEVWWFGGLVDWGDGWFGMLRCDGGFNCFGSGLDGLCGISLCFGPRMEWSFDGRAEFTCCVS